MSKMKWQHELVRFHVEFGPDSLFERVKFKMLDVHSLYMDGTHFNQRASERNIPPEVMEKLTHFDANEWTLKTAEVRKDRGKFYNSTWERVVDGKRYWVTIGIGNYITTIVCKETSGVEKCVRGGTYYDFVSKVNRELMDSEELSLVSSSAPVTE